MNTWRSVDIQLVFSNATVLLPLTRMKSENYQTHCNVFPTKIVNLREEEKMITQRATRLASIAGTALFSLFLATSVSAADVAKLVEDCDSCHGKDGASTEPEIPIIGGISALVLNDTMIAYKGEERPCPETEYVTGGKKGEKTTMCKVANELSDKEIEQLGEHYSSKPFVRAKQKFDPALAKKGKAVHDDLCEKCHEEGGSLASNDAGILAGQWMPYMRHAFKTYSSGERQMTKKMKKKYKKLSDEDIEALINYYASMQ